MKFNNSHQGCQLNQFKFTDKYSESPKFLRTNTFFTDIFYNNFLNYSFGLLVELFKRKVRNTDWVSWRYFLFSTIFIIKNIIYFYFFKFKTKKIQEKITNTEISCFVSLQMLCGYFLVL